MIIIIIIVIIIINNNINNTTLMIIIISITSFMFLVSSSSHECISERFQRELSDVTPPCTRPMDVRRHRPVYFLVFVPVTTVTVRPRHRLAEPLWHQRHVGNPLRLTAYRSRRPRGERNST